MSTIREQVIKQIAIQYRVDAATVSDEMTLKDDLGGDSLDHIELLFELEHAAGTRIDVTQWDDVQTVGDALLLVSSSRGPYHE